MSEPLGEWGALDDVDHAAVDVVELDPADTHEPADPEPTLYYGALDEFVREVVIDLYRRRVGPRAEFRWSARWWRSTEALVRLEAMWRSWENLRREPALGMSVWLLQHGDPQMRALMDPTGPFAGSEDTNRIGEPLPYASPPEGLFVDVRLAPD